METVASKPRQTIPRRKATVLLDNKTLKRSLAVHFQLYPLALAEKEQLATASAIFGNYDSTQSAMPIPVTRNAEPIRQNIWFRNTKCIQSDCSILGLSVQGSVSHIIIMHTQQMPKTYVITYVSCTSPHSVAWPCCQGNHTQFDSLQYVPPPSTPTPISPPLTVIVIDM